MTEDAHDMNTANWVPDLFMKKWRKKGGHYFHQTVQIFMTWQEKTFKKHENYEKQAEGSDSTILKQ